MNISVGVLVRLLKENNVCVTDEMMDMVIKNVGADVSDLNMIEGKDVLNICLRISDVEVAYNVMYEVFRRNTCHVEREEQLKVENARLKDRMSKIEANLRKLISSSFPHETAPLMDPTKVVHVPVKAPIKDEPKPHKVKAKNGKMTGKTPVVINISDLGLSEKLIYDKIVDTMRTKYDVKQIQLHVYFSELVGKDVVHQLAQRYAKEKGRKSTRTNHSSAATLCAYYYHKDNAVEKLVDAALD